MGRLCGWNWRESLFTGAMVCILSTMIVARVFAAERVEERLADTVGILVVQDLAAILLIAVMTDIAGGAGQPPREVARTAAELAMFRTRRVTR